MIKEEVTYEDFNGVQQTDTLYFHISKTEMMDLLELQPKLEAWQDLMGTEARELTIPEIREMLDLVKLLVEKSYGKRSDDGKKFRKNAEIWDDFRSSGAYDTFVYSLFEKPETAVEFLVNILPKGIVEEGAALETAAKPETVAVLPAENATMTSVDKEAPLYIRENRDATPKEIREMSREEMIEAFKWGNRENK